MPANRTWSATADGNYATSGNWGTTPVDGDSVDFSVGSVSVNAGLNRVGDTLVDVRVGPKYSGSVGNSEADPLIISASGIVAIKIGSGGKVFLKAGTDPIAKVIVQCESPADQVVLDGGTGGLGTVWVRRGTVKIVGTCTSLYVDPVNGDSSNVSLDLGAATITTMEGINCPFTQSGAGPTIATLRLYNTTVNFDYGTVAAIDLWPNARLNHNAHTNITSVNARYRATFDASGDPRTKTITNITKAPDAVVNLDNLTKNIVVTNDVLDLIGQPVLSYGSSI